MRIIRFLCATVIALTVTNVSAAEQFVFFEEQPNTICLSDKKGQIQYDDMDYKGVLIAVNNLKTDLDKVLGRHNLPIVVGTCGKSAFIDKLSKKKLINVAELKGKREKFIISIVKDQLVIAGSDKRGTIYGIYELCEQIGVSPWYDWADVPVEHQEKIFIKKGVFTDGEPAVRYRGIFLNDEAPCLSGWVGENYGGIYNHQFYARVFELVLRLKGNFMWPAMWNSSFYADDPLNMQTADDMGVIMGTSHHEPMAKAHKEWTRDKSHGAWNYDTNQQQLENFWKSGVERMRNTEDVVTIGMRGNGDEPMGEHADVQLLERIVKAQRRLIEEATGKPAEQTPQVWALYKEVQEYYEKGMNVPDDVILLLCDDNWGNVRILPELDGNNVQGAFAKRHPGGYGMYYHVDYVGGPRNSKWINVSQIQRIWEQMQLSYDYGVDKLWILNVGDLKPMEFPIDFWFRMAWNPARFNPDNLMSYTENFCRQQFGAQYAREAARILNLQCKYVHRRTAEQLDANTFSLSNGDWESKVIEYDQLNEDSKTLRKQLDKKYHDAYDQIIGFPVEAMDNLYNMYFALAMNRFHAEKGNVEANEWGKKVMDCFIKDDELCKGYNQNIAGGKWNHMMDQVHIGYRSWNDPRQNICPQTKNVEQQADNAESLVIAPSTAVVAEADEFVDAKAADGTQWKVIPHFGIYKDAIALFPYTKPVEGAEISYEVMIPDFPEYKQVVIALAPTFPFNSGRGHRLRVMLDGKEISTINVNEAGKYIIHGYKDQNYEWEKTRINKQKVNVERLAQGKHKITLAPLDPGIVIERISVE